MSDEDDFKQLMRTNYLEYASYVILDRAIPDVTDGLKPVQRRILHTLFGMEDGRLHKVANVVGQTMAYHPHGDAAIADALVNLANKDFLLDKQGNFGNLFTGDPASASRYIETRLSPLAKETLFNPDLTETIPSYDGRHQEPVTLPAKIPVLLLQGAEGIAVGMSTRILPHNFCECLQAQIDLLAGKSVELYPDFATGGVMDVSDYRRGKGKVKLRASITIKDDKTLTINDIPYGTTTEGLIRSIDEAAKRGKIKIESIHDYTSESVEIEINLPRGQHADELEQALYAFTDCEVSLNSIPLVIKDNLPWETDVIEMLEHHLDKLKAYFKEELEIEKERLIEKVFLKTLEQIFIENRLYKKIETLKTLEEIHSAIASALKPFHKQLEWVPTKEDRDRLLGIPIRRISRFDIDKNQDDIRALQDDLLQVEKHLKSIKKYTSNYLKGLLKKYGSNYPRKTEIQQIEQLDLKAISTKKMTVGFDPKKGFLGTKVTGTIQIECTNFDKLLLIFGDGTFQVINIPEKQFVAEDHENLVHFGIADKETVFNVVYKDPDTGFPHAKRFVVDKFILGRTYDYLPAGATLEFIGTGEGIVLDLSVHKSPRQKNSRTTHQMDSILIKGVKAKGIRLAKAKFKKVQLSKGSAHDDQLRLW